MTRVVATVLVHDNPSGAQEVLRRLEVQSVRPAAVLVVDNGSAAPLELTSSVLANVQVLRSDQNLGVGAGHNLGVRAALSSLAPDAIWILEHDTFPVADCLERLLSLRSRLQGTKVVVAEEVRNNYENARLGALDSLDGATLERFTLNGPLVDSEVFDRVGLLEEQFFVGQEDWEFSARVRLAGIPILRCSTGRVLHENVRTGRKFHGYVSSARQYYSSRNITWRDPPSSSLMRVLGYVDAGAKALWELAVRRRGRDFARARWWGYADAVNNRMGRSHRHFR